MALNFSSLEIGVRLAFEKGHLRETFSDREKKPHLHLIDYR